MASSTEICNLALSHLGVGKEIANLSTEQSEEASACRRYYDLCLSETLRDFNWSFTSKIDVLALVEETPNTEWDFSYRYPSDCVRLRRVLSGIRNDTRQTRVEYKIAQDSSGRLIFTNEALASIEYSALITDPDRYPSDFTMALSFRIAMFIAPRLTAGDPFKLAERAESAYSQAISRAASTALNEEQAPEDVQSEFIRARE